MSRKNEDLEAALAELSAAGIHDVIISRDHKHVQLRFETRGNNGAPRMYVVPSTPSDVRGPANARAGIRQILREDGMLPVDVKPVTPPPKAPDRVTLLERRITELESTVRSLVHQMTALTNGAMEIGINIPLQKSELN